MPAIAAPNPQADARRAARAASLHYVSGQEPGITRLGRPGRFRYLAHSGQAIRAPAILRRIAMLAIPPAWRDVWIAADPNAHLQATGRDARGRKQYRYHAGFAQIRDSAKYAHLLDFAAALPRLRQRLAQDISRTGLPREKILALVVSLLQQTLIRVGNEDYARANNSFGLTTLRNRHVKVQGADLRFMFRGKSGKDWCLTLHDPRLARLVRSCQELPGQHLFEYRGEGGDIHAVSSCDVNAYLRQISGRDITAKDFRTWAGTVKAAMGFSGLAQKPTRKAVQGVIASVAQMLGNTPAVCRKGYIHPAVIADCEQGKLSLRVPARARGGLSAPECAVLAYLRRHRLSGKPAR